MSLYASLMPNLHRWPKGRQICCPCTDTRARVPSPSLSICLHVALRTHTCQGVCGLRYIDLFLTVEEGGCLARLCALVPSVWEQLR